MCVHYIICETPQARLNTELIAMQSWLDGEIKYHNHTCHTFSHVNIFVMDMSKIDI